MSETKTETLQYLGAAIEKTTADGIISFTVRREGNGIPYVFPSLKDAQEFIDGWRAVQHFYGPSRIHNLVAAPGNGS